MLSVIANKSDHTMTPIRPYLKRFLDFDFQNWTWVKQISFTINYLIDFKWIYHLSVFKYSEFLNLADIISTVFLPLAIPIFNKHTPHLDFGEEGFKDGVVSFLCRYPYKLF